MIRILLLSQSICGRVSKMDCASFGWFHIHHLIMNIRQKKSFHKRQGGAFSKLSTLAWKKYTTAGAAVLTNMSYAFRLANPQLMRPACKLFRTTAVWHICGLPDSVLQVSTLNTLSPIATFPNLKNSTSGAPQKIKKQLLCIAETAAHERGPYQQTWNIYRRSFGDRKYLRRLLILNKIENYENHLFHTLLHIKTYHDYCFTSYEKMTKLHIKPVKL